MFESLTDSLQDVFHKIKGNNKLTAENVDSALIQLKKALIDADVSLIAIKSFLAKIRRSAVGEKVVKGLTPSDKFIQIVNDELIKLLGEKPEPLNFTKEKNNIILMMGLQGSGKTTTCAKLALTLKNQNKKVLLVALDLQRPAAIEQLSILAESIDVEIYKDLNSKSILEVAEGAFNYARENKINVLIFDTAGRLQVDSELMAELLILEKKYKPCEKLLVIDALMGQEAGKVAQTFDSQIGITGAILTKMDGDSRGGAALSFLELTAKKIKFAGFGEKIEALETFEPERIANRILGFGDIIALVKKFEEEETLREAEMLEKSITKGNFTFETFIGFIKFFDKLGGVANLFNMLGGASAFGMNMKSKEKQEFIEDGNQKIKLFECAIQSMTSQERKNPDLLYIDKSKDSRIKRISRGAGIKEEILKEMIDRFSQMRKFTKMFGANKNKMFNGGINPLEAAEFSQKFKKEEKKALKKEKGDIFSGGAFFRF